MIAAMRWHGDAGQIGRPKSGVNSPAAASVPGRAPRRGRRPACRLRGDMYWCRGRAQDAAAL